MPRRQLALIAALILGFLALIAHAAASGVWSVGGVLALAGFGVGFTAFALVLLGTRGHKPVEGHRGMPRWFWVLFASYVVGVVLCMLIAMLVLPFVGFRAFELLFDSEYLWVQFVAAAAALPFVRKHLL